MTTEITRLEPGNLLQFQHWSLADLGDRTERRRILAADNAVK
jgi:hypothetical protein